MLARKLLKLMMISAFAGMSLAANAATGVFNFAQQYSGDSMAASGATMPWVTATFADLAANSVRMTLTASGLARDQRVESLYFNLKTLAPTSLTFGRDSGPAAKIGLGENNYKAGGSGYYDILLSFDTRLNLNGSSNPNAFINARTSVYTITAPAGLSSASFRDLSSPTNGQGTGSSGYGPFYAAGHVVALTPSGGSAWINAASAPLAAPVPEPEIYATMLVGLALIGFVARRRRRSEYNFA